MIATASFHSIVKWISKNGSLEFYERVEWIMSVKRLYIVDWKAGPHFQPNEKQTVDWFPPHWSNSSFKLCPNGRSLQSKKYPYFYMFDSRSGYL